MHASGHHSNYNCSVFSPFVRSSIEISALESERRKLRSKVDMFQRQVRTPQRSEGFGLSRRVLHISAAECNKKNAYLCVCVCGVLCGLRKSLGTAAKLDVRE